MRTIYSSHVGNDLRLKEPPKAQKRIFQSEAYEISLVIYPGGVAKRGPQEDLVTFEVTYKDEGLRIVSKLWALRVPDDLDGYFRDAIRNLEKQGRGPFNMIGHAKKWTEIPLTLKDIAQLEAAGEEPEKFKNSKD